MSDHYDGLAREYLMVLGPLEHYCKRVEQVDTLGIGRRWINLAARTLIQRPIKRYSDFSSEIGREEKYAEGREAAANLDKIVDEINEFCKREDAHRLLINPKNGEVERLKDLTRKARLIVMGIKQD